MFDWDTLRIFLTTYRAGSLRAAAGELGNGHATVRRAIERLEESMKSRVFERSGQGIALTASGEILLEHAEAIERQAMEIERRVFGLDDVPRGRVAVSLPPALAGAFFAPFLAEFGLLYPEIEVDVLATNTFSDLTRHEADVSIRITNAVEDNVVGRKLVDYVLAAFASEAYLERVGVPESGDGGNAEWIGWGGENTWTSDTPFPKARARHRLPEVAFQVDAAAAGVGMAWIPAFLGDPDPRIVRVPGAEVRKARSIWLLLHRDLRNTARVRAFVDFFAKRVGDQRAKFLS